MMRSGRRHRAGESVEDYCRACKTDRMHTVIAADEEGRPIRVDCGFCHSEHNYRGGPRVPSTGAAAAPQRTNVRSGSYGGGVAARAVRAAPSRADREPFPTVSERERTSAPMAVDQDTDIELLLRRIIREETGITPVVPSDKWRGGTLVLRPGTAGLQERTWPIETFFHKIVMLRNRLRTLEQQVNGSELPDDQKVKLQGYISGCYGTLTSFNVLFADEDDQFKGAGGD
ncbi:MAG: hypothetical protein DMF97_01295 [Acidobacteria bacterium]|nr:MAG: hypothetical protein DMF97_01295 [Acidobacteriota bacterium]